MSRHTWCWPALTLVMFTGVTGRAVAQDNAQIVKQGKRATALVVLPSDQGFGSAFCIDPLGFFVTNAHVVRGVEEQKTVSLVLNAGEDDERLINATVLRRDATNDLALLKATKGTDYPTLELGDAGALTETDVVTAFGYPFGTILAVREKKYPNISVNVGRVTSLRKSKGQVDLIQLDAQLNPGNSGGPVVDTRGRVVGIVIAGIRGAGINFAIPVSHLNTLLEKPEIVFTVTSIAHGRQHERTRFPIRLVSFAKEKPRASVEMSLTAGADERKFVAEEKDGVFTVTAVPVPAPVGPKSIPLNLIFVSGRIQCQVPDQAIKVGNDTFQLSSLREIRQGKEPSVLTRDARTVAGPISGLGSVKADLGGYTTTIDLSKAPKIIIEHVEPAIDQVAYTIVVRHGEKVANTLKGTIRIEGRPVQPGPGDRAGAGIGPPILTADKTEVRLPAAIEQLAIGGGGKYLLLHLKPLGRLAVFDVSEAKIVHYLPAPAGQFHFAAGAEKLLVVLPEKKLIERWSLVTFEREASAPLPVEYTVQRIALGASSAGPILLWGEPDQTTFVDIETLKKITVKIEGGKIGANLDGHGLMIEAAPDGSAFTTWNRRTHTEEPSRFRILRLFGSTAELGSGLAMISPAHASIDGGPVFTGDGNAYTAAMKPIPAPELKGATLLPVLNSFVVVARWEGQDRKCRLAVRYMTDLKEAFIIGDLDELDGLDTGRTDWTHFSYEKRIQLIPDAKLLLTIPPANDRLVLRKLDVDEALKRSPVDYLFATSVPLRQAVKGTTFAHEITVKSKRGDVIFDLDSGPKGMTLSKTGRLTWDVPADFIDPETAVIVSIRDASGQRIFHSFTIRIR